MTRCKSLGPTFCAASFLSRILRRLLVNKDPLVPPALNIPTLQSSIGLWKLSTKSYHYHCTPFPSSGLYHACLDPLHGRLSLSDRLSQPASACESRRDKFDQRAPGALPTVSPSVPSICVYYILVELTSDSHGAHTMSPQAIQWCENHPNVCSHFSSGSNSTTTEKRQAPTEHYQLPDGMSYASLTFFFFPLPIRAQFTIEFLANTTHLDGRTSRRTGSTESKGAITAVVPMARR